MRTPSGGAPRSPATPEPDRDRDNPTNQMIDAFYELREGKLVVLVTILCCCILLLLVVVLSLLLLLLFILCLFCSVYRKLHGNNTNGNEITKGHNLFVNGEKKFVYIVQNAYLFIARKESVRI